MSADGDTVFVGAFRDDDIGSKSGSAYVFARNQSGTDNFGRVQKLLSSDGVLSDQFGYSVSISGATADVGAGDGFGSSLAIYGDFIVGGSPKRGEFGDEAVKAYAFRKVDVLWVESAELFIDSVSIRDEFGIGLAVDGKNYIVGSWLDNLPRSNNSGSAHLFGL